MTIVVAVAGKAPLIGGDMPAISEWRSAHRLPGASSWWDRMGIADGHWSNLNPDQGTRAQPDNSGARAAIYATAEVAATVSVTWPGNDAAGSGGPMVHVNPDATEFGLAFCHEPDILDGVWVLWEMGRQADDIVMVEAIAEPVHTDGVPVVLSMETDGTTVVCKVDGVECITATVPTALQGSKLHGAAVDVNVVPGRPAGVAVLVADLTIT